MPAAEKIIDPFVNVDAVVIEPIRNSTLGEEDNLDIMSMGTGSLTFKADRRGIRLGAEDFDEADFSVGMDGVMKAVAGRYIEKYEVGEALSDGNVVCLVPNHTDIVCTEDTYVDQNTINDDTNYSSSTDMFIGKDNSGFDRVGYVRFSMSSVPAPENILRAELRMTKRQFVGANFDLSISLPQTDWDVSTITHNNQPAADDVSSKLGVDESVEIGSGSDVVTIDVTQIVRQWKSGWVDRPNYGLKITASTGSSNNYANLYNRDHTLASAIMLRIYEVDDSDGQVYKACCDDYLYCRCILGVMQGAQSDVAGQGKIQTHGQVINMGNTQIGGRVYLDSTAGGITNSTTNLERIIRLGKYSGQDKVILNIQDEDVLIECASRGQTADGAEHRFYVPIDCRKALIYANDGASGTGFVFWIYRDRDGLIGPVLAEDSKEVAVDQGTNYISCNADFNASYQVFLFT